MPDAPTTDLASRWLPPVTVEGAWDARRRLAAQMRELADRCVTTEVGADSLDAAAALVASASALLPMGRTAFEAWQDGSYFDEVAEWVDRSALLGQSNPLAPPMMPVWDGSRSTVSLTLGESSRGAPGMVHGGVIAAIFDQLMGHAVVLSGTSAFTARLTVTYRRPTRLNRPLRFEAWIDRHSGRRILLKGAASDADGLTAEADALFAEVDHDRARAVIETDTSTTPRSR